MGKKDVKVSQQNMKGEFLGLKNYTWILGSESRQTETLTQDILALFYRLYYVPGHRMPHIEAKEGTKPTSIKNFKRQVSRIVSKPSFFASRQLTQTGGINSVETAKLESKAAVANANPTVSESAFVLIGITKEALFDTEAQVELSKELNRLHQLYPNTQVALTIFNDNQYCVGGLLSAQQQKLTHFSSEILRGIQQSRAQLLKLIDEPGYISVMIVNAATVDLGNRRELHLHVSEGEDWVDLTQRFKRAFPDLEQQRDIDDTNFEYLKAYFKISSATVCQPPAFTSIDDFHKMKLNTQATTSAPMTMPAHGAHKQLSCSELPNSLPDSFNRPTEHMMRPRSHSFYTPMLPSGDMPPQYGTPSAGYQDYPHYAQAPYGNNPYPSLTQPYHAYPMPPYYSSMETAHLPQGSYFPPGSYPLVGGYPILPTVPQTQTMVRSVDSAQLLQQDLSHVSTSQHSALSSAPVADPKTMAVGKSREEQRQELLQALAELRSESPANPSAPPMEIVNSSNVRALTTQWEQRTTQGPEITDGRQRAKTLSLGHQPRHFKWRK